jgi:hypothetical protein
MQSYRPTGVTLIAVLFFALGAVNVLSALLLLFIPLPDPFSGVTIASGVVGLLFAVLYMAVGWGLLQLKPWARIGALILSGLALLGYLLGGVLLIAGFDLEGVRIGFSGAGIGMLVLAVLPGLCLWYLLKPDIAALFLAGGGPVDYGYASPVSLPPTMTSAPPIPAPPAARVPAPAPMERTRAMEQPARAMAWLVVQGGPYAGKQFGLANGRNIIGRDGTRSDFILDDDLTSGQHAQVRFENGQFVVYDLASTNGTFVNNRRVQRQPLMDNDIVRLGNTQLVFKAVPTPRP